MVRHTGVPVAAQMGIDRRAESQKRWTTTLSKIGQGSEMFLQEMDGTQCLKLDKRGWDPKEKPAWKFLEI
jgi:hypothetical protein